MTEARKKRLLLVDDNRHLLTTLSDLLQFEGYDVDRAESGEEALERIEKQAPDLILLDISMPGMGGLGFLKRITREDGCLQYNVLVLTARAAMEDFFHNIPVDGFLAKPCAEGELLDKIREILDLHDRRQVGRALSGGRRVIVAEDNSEMAERLCHSLGRPENKLQVTVADTGPRLLELAMANVPDLVMVTDRLRGMNGAEVITLLSMIPKLQCVPTILYTQSPMEEIQRSLPDGGYRKLVRVVASANEHELADAAMEILARSA